MGMRGERALVGMMRQQQEQVDMGLPPMWNTYITVNDLEATVGKVAAAGGSVMAQPMEVMDAGRMAVIVDPVGGVVCLWQAKEHVGSEIVNEPGAFTWAELHTTDQVAVADFFGKVFRWKASKEDLGPGMQMTVFSVGDDVVASAMDVPMPGVPPHWQVYFGVDDCDAACAKVTELGGSILMPPMDAAPGRMAAVTDPAGAAFSIIAMAGQTG